MRTVKNQRVRKGAQGCATKKPSKLNSLNQLNFFPVASLPPATPLHPWVGLQLKRSDSLGFELEIPLLQPATRKVQTSLNTLPVYASLLSYCYIHTYLHTLLTEGCIGCIGCSPSHIKGFEAASHFYDKGCTVAGGRTKKGGSPRLRI